MAKQIDPAPHLPREPRYNSQRRKHCIRKRFHELYELQQLRYDTVISRLAFDEFFMNEKTISEMVRYIGRYKNDKKYDSKRYKK